MFCPMCGIEADKDAKYCKACGYKLEDIIKPSSAPSDLPPSHTNDKPAQEKVSQLKPWNRFLARLFDIEIFNSIIGTDLTLL